MKLLMDDKRAKSHHSEETIDEDSTHLKEDENSSDYDSMLKKMEISRIEKEKNRKSTKDDEMSSIRNTITE